MCKEAEKWLERKMAKREKESDVKRIRGLKGRYREKKKPKGKHI